MARPKQNQPPPPPGPEVEPEIGIKLLRRQIDSAKALVANRPIQDDAYYSWRDESKTYLDKAFGKNVKHLGSGGGRSVGWDVSEAQIARMNEQDHFETLTSDISKLEGYIRQLETEIELRGHSAAEVAAHPAAIRAVSANLRNVFVVHGHDEAARETLCRFLEKLDLKPIVLHEQANQGKTIIEKFEHNADVAFAVVLLTPDDLGKANPETEYKPRARQNVVLELGYFMGALGRSKVCCLYKRGVDIPSDYSGVIYTEMDAAGGWKLSLAKEIKVSGIEVDLNKAFA